MVTAPTVSISNASSQDARLLMSNHAGARLRVASVTTTTVTVDSAAELTGDSLYTATNPGLLVVLDGQATSDNGLTANVTGISSNALTVDVDFTSAGSAPALADGDIVVVIPPLAVELSPNGGHTLDVAAPNDETKGFGETFLTHNTPNTVDVSGSVPLFLGATSEGLGRALAFGVGGYKKSGTGVHQYRPMEADDGTFAASDDACFYDVNGNNVVQQVFYGAFCGGFTIDFPEGSLASSSFDVTGNGVVREVGGAGKEFPSGANNWDTTAVDCDTGSRFNFNAAFVEKGGTFGNDLTDARENTVTSASLQGTRGMANPRPLGTPYTVKPTEFGHDATLTLTRILEDDDFYSEFYNDGPEPTTGKGTDRVLVKCYSAVDPTKYLEIDIPKAQFVSTITRQEGHFVENITLRAQQTTDSDGCVDTANPLYQIELANGDDTDYLSSL